MCDMTNHVKNTVVMEFTGFNQKTVKYKISFCSTGGEHLPLRSNLGYVRLGYVRLD
jgi:hypothetical protein